MTMYMSESRNDPAPTMREIKKIHDIGELEEIIERAEEVSIGIKISLEYLSVDEGTKRRMVDALTYWKVAEHHAKKRMKIIMGANKAA